MIVERSFKMQIAFSIFDRRYIFSYSNIKTISKIILRYSEQTSAQAVSWKKKKVENDLIQA